MLSVLMDDNAIVFGADENLDAMEHLLLDPCCFVRREASKVRLPRERTSPCMASGVARDWFGPAGFTGFLQEVPPDPGGFQIHARAPEARTGGKLWWGIQQKWHAWGCQAGFWAE